MKNIIKISIKNVALFCFIWVCFSANAQTYIRKYDVSGVIENPSALAEIEAKTNDLVEGLPAAALNNFKVFDAGFYMLKGFMGPDEYQKAFDKLRTDAAAESKYFIAIGRQSDDTGFYVRFFVEVNLPPLDGACDFNPLAKAFLQNQLNQNYDKLSRNPQDASLAIAMSLESFKTYAITAKSCCLAGKKLEQCTACQSNEGRKAYLSSLGFTPISIQNIGTDNQPYSAPEIDNKAKLLFTINDLDAVDLGTKYKTIVQVFKEDNMKIKVFITKDENLCTPEWEEMLKTAQSDEYDVVYWHHIQNGGIGNEYLYTTAYIKGGNKDKRIVANLIAALAGAATDFLMQVVVHYLFDEDIPNYQNGGLSWAVNRVDKYEVGKSAVFGLFGINGKVEVVVTALATATRETIKLSDYYANQSPPKDYGYTWAAKDFGTYFLQNLATEGLGMLLGNTASKALGKVKAIPFPGWCKIAGFLNKRLGTMIPGCFVAGTQVQTLRGKVPIEKLQPDDWILSDTTLNPNQFVDYRQAKVANIEKKDELWAGTTTPELITTENSITDTTAYSGVLNIPFSPEYDFEDITPDTWQVVQLSVHKNDGSIAEVSLLRPNTWLKEHDLNILGDSTWLNMPDMNITGMAYAKGFRSTNIDTRTPEARNTLARGYYPVITSFKHKSDHVLHLGFTNGDRIGTTTMHPFWSMDRDGWVAASDLQPYEKVKTTQGYTVLDTLWIDFNHAAVFNLETWKTHNYVVENEVVHNVCYSFFDLAQAFKASANNLVSKVFQSKTGAIINLAWKKVGNKIEFGDRSLLKQMLGIPSGSNMEAHHLITWAKGGNHSLVQAAAEDGFHLNMVENGIGLPKYVADLEEGVHGNHPAYDEWLVRQLDKWEKKFPNYTTDQAHAFLQMELIPVLRNQANEAWASGKNLNQYFKNLKDMF